MKIPTVGGVPVTTRHHCGIGSNVTPLSTASPPASKASVRNTLSGLTTQAVRNAVATAPSVATHHHDARGLLTCRIGVEHHEGWPSTPSVHATQCLARSFAVQTYPPPSGTPARLTSRDSAARSRCGPRAKRASPMSIRDSSIGLMVLGSSVLCVARPRGANKPLWISVGRKGIAGARYAVSPKYRQHSGILFTEAGGGGGAASYSSAGPAVEDTKMKGGGCYYDGSEGITPKKKCGSAARPMHGLLRDPESRVS